MSETIYANLYDYPKYYDLLFGSDCQAEYDFLIDCFDKHVGRKVKRLFEPACGTGRLLIKFAKAGYEVSGVDLNDKAVDFCNARLERGGFPASVFVGDMSNFRVRKRFDAAFNTINSFRHLGTEEMAAGHLRCMADALNPGGIYALGFNLTPERGPYTEDESWDARRGHLSINSYMWTKQRDRRNRNEKFGLQFDIYTPTKHFRIEDEMDYRMYSAGQFQSLLDSVGAFEVAETYDFRYRIDEPVEITPRTEDVVYILRKRK